jgi:hypothetical protein
MGFGMTMQRFGVLQHPLRISPLNIGRLMQTIARLHNFCLTENNDYSEMNRFTAAETPRQLELGLETNGEQTAPTAGVSYLRESLVKRVKDTALGCVAIAN